MRPRLPSVTRGHGTVRAALLTCSLALVPSPADAQDVRIFRAPGGGVEQRVLVSSDRPMIGVTTAAESARADTLGLLVESVTPASPAAKAGLKEGDRLQAVNGVSLRADRADAGEEDYSGVLNRRLQREVQRTKPGESIDLRVLSGGQVRTVKVTPVKASELDSEEMPGFRVMRADGDRAVLGLSIASTGSARDTLGVFVQAVTKDGPAEKAGIVEGDRIAAINGVSLRVPREDADDGAVGASRVERLSREVAKLKAGEAAELTVVSGGRSRTVRVTAVKASELPRGGGEIELMRSLMPGMLPQEMRFRTMPDRPDVRIIRPELRRRIEEGERSRSPVIIRRSIRTDA